MIINTFNFYVIRFIMFLFIDLTMLDCDLCDLWLLSVSMTVMNNVAINYRDKIPMRSSQK